MTICANADCGHDRVMHPRALACRMCGCLAFVVPDPPAEDPGHRHAWQPAGVVTRVNGDDYIAALCQCGEVIRLQVPRA